jgi:hypothetical protein
VDDRGPMSPRTRCMDSGSMGGYALHPGPGADRIVIAVAAGLGALATTAAPRQDASGMDEQAGSRTAAVGA